MNELELDALLSEPTPALVEAFRRIAGDILILGVAGKMGPSLARLAVLASREAGTLRRITGVARFQDNDLRDALERDGVSTIAADLLDPDHLNRLPEAPNVISMVGRKFGTVGDEPATWATNTYLAGAIAQRFVSSRLVAFSTGNVYPLHPAASAGPSETGRLAPVGEYAQSALARERVLEFFATRNGTAMAILRLNYAIEPRYGVLRDIADRVYSGQPIDVAMGYVNVIWQRDANAVALRTLEHCASPPFVLNVTGRVAASVRDLAQAFADRFGIDPVFRGVDGAEALLSDAARCDRMFGPPPVGLDQMIDIVADWVQQGGRSLGRPTHFGEREGRF